MKIVCKNSKNIYIKKLKHLSSELKNNLKKIVDIDRIVGCD